MTWCQRCTCVQLSSLREIHINIWQLFVPFLLFSLAVGNMLWQNTLKWKQSPSNSPRRVHENRGPKMLTLWMWHMGDVFRARGRGGKENGNTCLYSSRNTESTGLHFTNWLFKNWLTAPTGSTHLYSTSPWLYICLLPVTQTLVTVLAGHLLPNCTPEGCGHHWHVRETAGTIRGTGKYLQRHLAFPWQRWTWVVRVRTTWLELVEIVWRLQLKCGMGVQAFMEGSVRKFSLKELSWSL